MAKLSLLPPQNVVTSVTYGDAKARGQMRLFKAKLARDYAAFDKGYAKLDGRNPKSPVIDFDRKSGTGQRRALARIKTALGSGAVLEGLRLDGKHRLAVFSILKPRNAVVVGHDDGRPIPEGLKQDCVTVQYVLTGVFGDDIGITEGLWTIELPDHALGRAVSAGEDPAGTIREAHHNVLALKATDVIDDTGVIGRPGHSFLVKAGRGGFICTISTRPDVSLGGELAVHVRAETWVASEMLFENQKLLVGNGEAGERLGDSYLLPPPLRKLEREGDLVRSVIWSPGLPELLAAARGTVN
jgi:hypothetical protein